MPVPGPSYRVDGSEGNQSSVNMALCVNEHVTDTGRMKANEMPSVGQAYSA